MFDGVLVESSAAPPVASGPVARSRGGLPDLAWKLHAPLIAEIDALKRARGAVILAHNYMTPEIFHGVGDFVGDSLALAKEAARSDAPLIVQAGVHFMAETSKVLCARQARADPRAWRPAAPWPASITAEDVRLIRARHPGLPVVTYVNTTAAVKAETDVCCTSANAVQVVQAVAAEWGVDRVILLPDEFLAKQRRPPDPREASSAWRRPVRGARALHRRRRRR